jgi:hypothetical protein
MRRLLNTPETCRGAVEMLFFGSIDVDAELAQLGPPGTGCSASATPSSDGRTVVWSGPARDAFRRDTG